VSGRRQRTVLVAAAIAGRPRSRGICARAARTRRGAIGLALAAVVVAVAVLGPLVAPHPSTDFVTTPYAPPGHGFLLGGDTLGRDVLSRVLDGGWLLLAMAALATLLGVGLGAAVGITAAYRQGFTEHAMMRTVDVALAFPQLVLALLLVSIAGPKVSLIVAAVAVGHMPQVARVIRAATLAIAESDYVKSAQLIGIRSSRVITRHIVPNLVTPLINENRIGIASNPWAVVVPAALIALLTVGVNTYTDAIARVAIGDDGGLAEVAISTGVPEVTA
jgi:peptide/nickel transport system permease protein